MSVPYLTDLQLGYGDALLIVEVQKDFLLGGSRPVPGGDEVIPIRVGRYAEDRAPAP